MGERAGAKVSGGKGGEGWRERAWAGELPASGPESRQRAQLAHPHNLPSHADCTRGKVKARAPSLRASPPSSLPRRAASSSEPPRRAPADAAIPTRRQCDGRSRVWMRICRAAGVVSRARERAAPVVRKHSIGRLQPLPPRALRPSSLPPAAKPKSRANWPTHPGG